MFKSIVLASIAASAVAFAPAATFTTRGVALNMDFGKYDDKMWDNTAKKDVYDTWDPAVTRSTMNFNPFETYKGNSPDASGIFPGEAFYKDPQRGEASFSQMMIERTEAEERAASPKAGFVKGCAGCTKPEGNM
uniref:Uncharacterized protein n=1 Tax=Proboscia inermis TaxID=420281 RepID=A0A7S0CCP4_9STRA|mmetsp:Transcript_38801/g.39228  ORF Transcript_38801/g.39228 Transcript_38801/m.39228 type:complete len:134 (+) Transcript_38801:77-478(+)